MWATLPGASAIDPLQVTRGFREFRPAPTTQRPRRPGSGAAPGSGLCGEMRITRPIVRSPRSARASSDCFSLSSLNAFTRRRAWSISIPMSRRAVEVLSSAERSISPGDASRAAIASSAADGSTTRMVRTNRVQIARPRRRVWRRCERVHARARLPRGDVRRRVRAPGAHCPTAVPGGGGAGSRHAMNIVRLVTDLNGLRAHGMVADSVQADGVGAGRSADGQRVHQGLRDGSLRGDGGSRPPAVSSDFRTGVVQR